MSISQVMNKDVLTVMPSTTLMQLIKLMRRTNQHMFPVIDEENNLLGIVNYRGICNIFRPFSKSVSEIVKRMPFVEAVDDEDLNLELSPEMGMLILVDDIINTTFISVKETDTIQEAHRRTPFEVYSLAQCYRISNCWYPYRSSYIKYCH